MRTYTALILLALLVATPAAAMAAGQRLTDAELDEIIAGADVCSMFGLSAPCVVSYYDVVQPIGGTSTTSSQCFVNGALAPCTATSPPPVGTCVNCSIVQSTAGLSPSPNTSVKVKQTYRSGGISIIQSQRFRR